MQQLKIDLNTTPMGRFYANEKRLSRPHYSKQDILEQYCISEKGFGALENGKHNIFGCLSSHSSSFCSSGNSSSILTACVRQRGSSDENLYELYKRHPTDYTPFPKRRPLSPISYEDDLKTSYFRRKPHADPSRYTWMLSDDESVRMEKPTSISDLSIRGSKKHVSFARSHTLTSFDDAMCSLSSSLSQLNSMSQERLLHIRNVNRLPTITKQPEFSENKLIKLKPMKTQATQTDMGLCKNKLTSPNIQRAAQTNGINGRKLLKSLSEMGCNIITGESVPLNDDFYNIRGHEPLQRTQSDEPPRSPYITEAPILTIPAPLQEDPAQSESSSVPASEDSVETKKEIFIDFKPQMMQEKKQLKKTFSDGLILTERRRKIDDGVVPNVWASYSQENTHRLTMDPIEFKPHFQKVPIRNEGICRTLDESNIYSSIDEPQSGHEFIEEEFHENIFMKNESSIDSSESIKDKNESVVPSIFLPPEISTSPFESNDSIRDHSDEIWNESQVTVLQMDGVSCLDVRSSESSLLTPTSNRRHMLMLLHQERSSIDTNEYLDEEEMVPPKPTVTFNETNNLLMKTLKLKSTSLPRRRKTEWLDNDGNLSAVVPDIHLNDGINDQSESTTTTDDYITANSGTDSSRRSTSTAQVLNEIGRTTIQIENRLIFAIDDMVVPTSAQTIELSDTNKKTIPQISTTGRSTPSDDSSSCGSYSIEGSTSDLLDRLENAKKRRDVDTMKILTVNYKLKETTKRSKTRTRSPLAGGQKKERIYNKQTSDESSTGREYPTNEVSPRKNKKTKDVTRRRSLPRSPVNQKNNSKKGHQEMQSTSLPGSLSRRKSGKVQRKKKNAELHTPATCKETTTLKALSAESLRSISPGSDSVFYSDPSTATAEHQLHCLHCGKEVGVNNSPKCQESVIVRPPAGFEDSPKMKPSGRFKKFDSRLKSEERTHNDYRRHRYRTEIRAKSEERSGGTNSREKLRPMQRSPTCSKEQLKTADSSPSILPGAPDDEDDNNDQELYEGCYGGGRWFCITDSEIFHAAVVSPIVSSTRRDSVSSTESEKVFRKRHQTVTHRCTHRKPYVDMYKRLYYNSFEIDAIMREKLEEVVKLMLIVWCRGSKANELICTGKNECDKTIVVHRESGEFGFRIHGSKPVVVTAIEPGTPAESSGLEVGDIIIGVNGINVMDRSHSDVVQIAHANNDTLTLEIARTSYALTSSKERPEGAAIVFSGYLWKLGGFAMGSTTNKWTRRWFCLRMDNCLYCYKTDSDKQPVGVVMLVDQKIREVESDSSKPNSFVIHKDGIVSLYLAADSFEIRSKWMDAIESVLRHIRAPDEYLEDTKRKMALSANAIQNPECLGYLVKLGNQWKSWNRRYCLLKDCALYFYHDSNSPNAFGVVLLQGYKVQQSTSSKKHGFEIVPQEDPSKKHYYFHADSDVDKKRWITALEYSIDRWINLMNS